MAARPRIYSQPFEPLAGIDPRLKVVGLRATDRIHHYLRPFRLLQALEARCLWLADVRAWVDPYEGWWCDQMFRAGSRLSGVTAFGHCWTTTTDSEPLWRLNEARCPRDIEDVHGPAVRITTTVEALARAIADSGILTRGRCYLGRVQYDLKGPELRDAVAQSPPTTGSRGQAAASALCFKRKAFEFEAEVRLLFLQTGPGLPEHLQVPIDPVALLRRVTIGPVRSNQAHAAVVVREALKAHGLEFKEGIKDSWLYTDVELVSPSIEGPGGQAGG